MNKNLLFLTLIVFNLHASQEGKAVAESAAAANPAVPVGTSPKSAFADEPLSPRTAKAQFQFIRELMETQRNFILAMTALPQERVDDRLTLSRSVWARADSLAFKIQKQGPALEPREMNKDDIKALNAALMSDEKMRQEMSSFKDDMREKPTQFIWKARTNLTRGDEGEGDDI